MSTTSRLTAQDEIEYLESDGKRMAENTLQYEWISKIKGGLDIVFCDDPNVFIAGDLFWYPVQYNSRIRRAPDVMVALGRPKGHTRTYLQWNEDGIASQVVFEILSPSNRRGREMARKFRFYEMHGVEEYYIYGPDYLTLEGWLQQAQTLEQIATMDGWISPRLRVRFEHSDDEFRLYAPDGKPFVSMLEYAVEADEQSRRAERLAAKLRDLGIEPE